MNSKMLIGGLTAILLIAGACSKSGTTNQTTNTTTTTTASNTTNRTTAPPASNTSNTSTSNTSSTNTSASTEGKQDFTLINETGIEIDQLYVAPHTDAEWSGDTDILGRDTLPTGARVDIKFSPREQAALWDMKIVDTNGKAVEWNSLNLLEISEITLRYKDGQPTAEVR
jgi:cytoskeletal protein RodZ